MPHSEAYYGATPCGQPIQDNGGHPDNARQAAQLVVDAVDALAAAQPDFPWADYDIEDQGDADGDGNLFEPDGVIDHFVIIHAGADKADDGGAEGTYAIWSHASNVDPATGGYAVPGPASRSTTTSCRPRTPASGSSPTSSATTWGCPTCTTPAARPSPTSTSGT